MTPIVSISHQRNKALIFFLFLFALTSPVSAAIYLANGTEIPADALSSSLTTNPSPDPGFVPVGTVVFFTNSHCSACRQAKGYLANFSARHPEISLITYDLFDSPDNWRIFEDYKQKYHRNFFSVPLILVGNLSIEGSQDIGDHLDEIVLIQSKNEHS